MAINLATGSRPGTTRGRILGGSPGNLSYPSPFFDIAHTYLPRTVKELFYWCRYYFMTNPLINATVFKLAEYPITDVVIEHDDENAVRKWRDYLQDDLNYDTFRLEAGLDYYVYGNVYVSIYYPFLKLLRCTSCRHTSVAKHIRSLYQFTGFDFMLTCPHCHHNGKAVPIDWPITHPRGTRLVRWNPEDIEVSYSDLTGDVEYYYRIPPHVKNDIVLGKKDVLERTPQAYFSALKDQKGLLLTKDNLFHLKRPALSTPDRGTGTPLLLPVLKDTFYLQVMKKAQEAILLEHIVPLRMLFPQGGSGTSDPFTTINLVEWRDHVANEIARWRQDPNYIPIMPLPVGNQTIGGDGRSLLLGGEIQQMSEHIMMGMQVPREFLIGGLSWAGTNVSLRMLENSFLTYIGRHTQLLKWVIKKLSAAFDWPTVSTRFKPFKMADDLQRKSLLYQMNKDGKISDTTLLGEFDLKMAEENEVMTKETDSRLEATKKQQLAMAEVQGEAQLIMSRYQVKAEQAMAAAQAAPPAQGEPGAAATPPGDPMAAAQSPLNVGSVMGPGQGGGMSLLAMAKMHAQSISAMTPDMQQQALANLQAQSPELAQLVVQILKQSGTPPAMGAGAGGGAPPGVDSRPLPEQRAPRRAGASV